MHHAQITAGDLRLALLGGECHSVEVIESCDDEPHGWICRTLESGYLCCVEACDLGDLIPLSPPGEAGAAHVSLCRHSAIHG
ncbi:MAG TPA: hypothetical protein VGX78_04695 [Pirellulales bacterium]|jgi:hypothetical protein|nr:hypothetical protein [Pirellulales bacterium]